MLYTCCVKRKVISKGNMHCGANIVSDKKEERLKKAQKRLHEGQQILKRTK